VRRLFDENLSPAQAEVARQLGHDAVAVLTVGLAGKDDATIRAAAIREGRILVTLDADFANVQRYPPGSTPGVLRLRLHPATETAITGLLRWALPRLEELPLQGKLVVAEPGRIRIRGVEPR